MDRPDCVPEARVQGRVAATSSLSASSDLLAAHADRDAHSGVGRPARSVEELDARGDAEGLGAFSAAKDDAEAAERRQSTRNEN